MLEFKSLSSATVRNDKYFAVSNPIECDNFDHLIGSVVLVDGKKEKVTGVERFAHSPPWRKSEKIGLMVAA